MTPPTKRQAVLTETDLDNIEERWQKSACNRGITDADAVFLRTLRQGTESTMSMVWKAFLLLCALGLLLLAGAGFLAQGLKFVKGMV